jgi:uncharacterized membrane protein
LTAIEGSRDIGIGGTVIARTIERIWNAVGMRGWRHSNPEDGKRARRGAFAAPLSGCGALLLATTLMGAEPARADFRLCNNTGNRIGVAVGYKENEGWTTEGWWNLAARSCETVLRGSLVARFYYIYAVDYDRGGEWSGQAFMCTREKEFTIRGTEDCLARGYDRSGFFEVDTGDQPSWTVQLTESADQVPMQPLQSRVPMLQTPPAAGRPGTPPPPSRSRN